MRVVELDSQTEGTWGWWQTSNKARGRDGCGLAPLRYMPAPAGTQVRGAAGTPGSHPGLYSLPPLEAEAGVANPAGRCRTRERTPEGQTAGEPRVRTRGCIPCLRWRQKPVSPIPPVDVAHGSEPRRGEGLQPPVRTGGWGHPWKRQPRRGDRQAFARDLLAASAPVKRWLAGRVRPFPGKDAGGLRAGVRRLRVRSRRAGILDRSDRCPVGCGRGLRWRVAAGG